MGHHIEDEEGQGEGDSCGIEDKVVLPGEVEDSIALPGSVEDEVVPPDGSRICTKAMVTPPRSIKVEDDDEGYGKADDKEPPTPSPVASMSRHLGRPPSTSVSHQLHRGPDAFMHHYLD